MGLAILDGGMCHGGTSCQTAAAPRVRRRIDTPGRVDEIGEANHARALVPGRGRSECRRVSPPGVEDQWFRARSRRRLRTAGAGTAGHLRVLARTALHGAV